MHPAGYPKGCKNASLQHGRRKVMLASEILSGFGGSTLSLKVLKIVPTQYGYGAVLAEPAVKGELIGGKCVGTNVTSYSSNNSIEYIGEILSSEEADNRE